MTNKQRDRYLRRKYGIGIKDYNRILKAQKGKCAICGKPPKPGKNLHVDHDHVTGDIRGLLDFYCNKRVVGRNRADSVQKLVLYVTPWLDLVVNDLENHMIENQTRHMGCTCLHCVLEEINFGRSNK